MRIDVKKFLFIGMEEERSAFFKKAQDLGLIQFIDIRSARTPEIPEELKQINYALKVIRELAPAAQEEPADGEFEGIVRRIAELKHRKEALYEEQRMTRLEIARVHVFGDFSLEDIRLIEKQRKIQFFCAKEGAITALSPEIFYVGTDQGLDYFVSISKEGLSPDQMIEMQIDHPLGVLKTRLKEKESEAHAVEQELKKYAKYNTFLHQALNHQLNRFNLRSAEQLPREEMEGALFAVEGWIPADKISSLHTLTEDLLVHFEEIAIEKNEVIPTYLENTGVSRIGEDLVHFFDTPSATDKDPSLWVLCFFAFFFAMIIADAGYGLLYLAGALYMSNKAGKSRFTTLALILCSACVVWGVLINSFFGINIAPSSPLRKISLLQWLVDKKADFHLSQEDEIYNEWLVKYPHLGEVKNYTEFLQKGVSVENGKERFDILNTFSDNIMLELSLLIGVIHICLSFARYLDRNWAGAGWILAIIGGYLYVPFYLHATSLVQFVFGWNREAAAENGFYLLIGGIILAVVLSLIQNRLFGLLEITQTIQIFSDVLSYLRLYALGLAGAIISVTVNEIAGSVHIVLGIVLLIIGHGINMVLSIMGGVINGLRLNYLEWYHYSFQGGGKQFSPLSKIGME